MHTRTAGACVSKVVEGHVSAAACHATARSTTHANVAVGFIIFLYVFQHEHPLYVLTDSALLCKRVRAGIV